MEQEQCLQQKRVNELDLMMTSLDLIEGSVKILRSVSDFATSILAHLPEIQRTPEEEREWQEIEKTLNDETEQSLAKSRREDEARFAEREIFRIHAHMMFAELPEDSCLSVAQVRQDYYERKARAESSAALC